MPVQKSDCNNKSDEQEYIVYFCIEEFYSLVDNIIHKQI